MKTFCIAGPIIPEDHYYIPQRLDFNKLDQFLDNKYYFLLHAPRQSGKTTAILEYAKYLNEKGKYTALYLTTEPAHTAKNDVERMLYWLISQFKVEIGDQLSNQREAINFLNEALKKQPIPENTLYNFLHFWAKNNSKPLVVFFDEVDGLVENSLVSLLKQLRTGYTKRPHLFPQSICLIGVRNLQDYKLQSIENIDKGILVSPFNILADSILLKNFSLEQVHDLYSQHTKETGQVFTEEAISYSYCLTQGQPWLVNALAYQACFRDVLDRSIPVTKYIMESAKEQLILRKDTHIAALVDRLYEPRVRNIIDAIVSGSDPISFNPDDIQYVRDLGLVKEKSWEIANPIYQQIVPRALTYVIQELIPNQTSWYLDSLGKLDMVKLLKAFTQFFRENAEAYESKLDYKESFPHILLLAFLQRIVNGGGQICREYAVGRKRIDILIIWKNYRYVLELKIKYGENSLPKGLEQTVQYADLSNAQEAHLIIFDRDATKTWDQKISDEVVEFNSRKVHVWTL